MSERNTEKCAFCGACTAVCPVYRVTGRESLTARGRMHLLGTALAEHPSESFEDIFAECLLCGACEDVCARGLSIREQLIEARSRFSPLYGRHGLQKTIARLALGRSGLLQGLLTAGVVLENLHLIPAESGLRIRLGLIEKRAGADLEGLKTTVHSPPSQAGISYFAGCHARFLQPSVAEATRQLVRRFCSGDPAEPAGQVCCGLAAWSAGKKKEARRLAKSNIEAFAGSEDPILTSCASCSSHLGMYPELFKDDPRWRAEAEKFSARIREFSGFIDEVSSTACFQAPEKLAVRHHEPCHLRFGAEKQHAVDVILNRVANITLIEPEGGQHCCGQGGLFHLDYPEVSEQVFTAAAEAFQPLDSGIVVTSCSGCLMQWQAGLAHRGSEARAVHLAVFLAGCLDIDA